MQQSIENSINSLAQCVSGLDKKLDESLPGMSSKIEELEQKLEYLQVKSGSREAEPLQTNDSCVTSAAMANYSVTDLFNKRINFTMSADSMSIEGLNKEALKELADNTSTDAFTGAQHLNMLIASCCTPKEILKNPRRSNLSTRFNLSQAELDYIGTSAYSEHLIQPNFIGRILCETATTPLVDLIPKMSTEYSELQLGVDHLERFNIDEVVNSLRATECQECPTFAEGKYKKVTEVRNITIKTHGRMNCVNLAKMRDTNYIPTFNPITTLLTNMYNELMCGVEGTFIIDILRQLNVKRCSTDFQIIPNQIESAVDVLRRLGDVYIIVNPDSIAALKNILYMGKCACSPINSVMSALIDDVDGRQSRVRWVCSDDVPKLQFAEGSNRRKLVDGSFVAYVIVPDKLATMVVKDPFTVRTKEVDPARDCATIAAWHKFAIHHKCLNAGYMIRAHDDSITLS